MLHEFIKKLAIEYGEITINYNDKEGFVVSCELSPGYKVIKRGWSLSWALGLLESELSYNTK